VPSAQRARGASRSPLVPEGHYYFANYLSAPARDKIFDWLVKLRPIWEERYPTGRPLPPGRQQRRLLRPVYWLGNWQFACLDYYRPPRGVEDRCVAAEPFPPVLAQIVGDIESKLPRWFPAAHVPRGFHFNTCLVNFYGSRKEGERWIDTARVGEHRDFEPGPVASLSLGERALLQFVLPHRSGERAEPLLSQWLDDGSLQVFGGPLYKARALHRVQRVDRRTGKTLPPEIPDFSTRRINFTFRYVPDQHVIPFAQLGPIAREDVRGYVERLSLSSPFFKRALDREKPSAGSR
jgi:alkylated DNA repair dioxygenase AlkB